MFSTSCPLYQKNSSLKYCHVLQCKLSSNWISVVTVFDVSMFFISIESFSFKIYVVTIGITLFETWPQSLFHHRHRFWPNLIKCSPEIPKWYYLRIISGFCENPKLLSKTSSQTPKLDFLYFLKKKKCIFCVCPETCCGGLIKLLWFWY